ncbi:Cilia- and flagella-associated protein 58, partial [Plecturocebus cupreus]
MKGIFLVLMELLISTPGSALYQEKEKLYVELKHVLARQPGPEAAEQLKLYRRTLYDKKEQLKVLSSELNMYEVQSKEYKHEVEKLTIELQNLKKKYLAQKLTGSCYVAQVGLELLASNNPPASASQRVEITGQSLTVSPRLECSGSNLAHSASRAQAIFMPQPPKNKNKAPMEDTLLIAKPDGPGFTGGGFPLTSTK